MLTNKTVLAIDDDYAITELLSIILRSHGFDVITANNSEDGLRLIAEKSPNVITLDLMMPDINGWEMCEKIRTFSKIPILVLSAINDPAMVAKCIGCRCGRFHCQTSAKRSLDRAFEYVIAAFKRDWNS